MTSVENLNLKSHSYSEKVEAFLNSYFKTPNEVSPKLLESIRYSLLQKGAKRFRANLVCFTAEACGTPIEKVLPFAAAVECVHAYSLIHDDLPSMDNDDFRRGEATNHKVFGEATALLAGDALLGESFSLIAQKYASEPSLGLALVGILSRAAGPQGMISGQMRDLESQSMTLKNIDELKLMHEQKTGALILAAVEGASLIANANQQQKNQLKDFAKNLGLAFQVKDDLLDFSEDEGASYTGFLGLAETEKFLKELTRECLAKLAGWDQRADSLKGLATYNMQREN